MPVLPKGKRSSDVQNEHGRVKALRFRLALAARKYPIQLAVMVSLAVVSYPVVLLIDAKNDLTEATKASIAATAAVQESREYVTRSDCLAQNKRHDDAVTALRIGSTQDIKNATTEAAKTEIRRRRDVTLALLDAVQPHQDCEALVRKLDPDRVGTGG